MWIVIYLRTENLTTMKNLFSVLSVGFALVPSKRQSPDSVQLLQVLNDEIYNE